jgi:hypothetical protein
LYDGKYDAYERRGHGHARSQSSREERQLIPHRVGDRGAADEAKQLAWR